MSTPKGRIQKLNEILETLEKNKGKMKFRALYGALALKYGTTENTLYSYLDALNAAGKIDYPHGCRIDGIFEVQLVK